MASSVVATNKSSKQTIKTVTKPVIKSVTKPTEKKKPIVIESDSDNEDDIEEDNNLEENNIKDDIEENNMKDDIEEDNNIEENNIKDDIEEENNIDYEANKFSLCVLKTQVGKTFTAIGRINSELELDSEFGKSIHIVFTMNTLLNGKQFSKRLESIEKKYGKGSIVILASKYTGEYKHVSSREALQGLLLDKKSCPRVAVMCSNHTRYVDGVKIMQVLEENPTNIKRAFVYYDELHQYINREVRKQIEHIHNLKITNAIYALTATPDKIWQSLGFWSRLKLHYFDDYNDENYIGFEDMKFNNVDDYYNQPYVKPSPFEFALKAQQTVGFARHVLEQYPNILSSDTRIFIPGHLKRSSHLEIRDLAFEVNWESVVIVLNGELKKIFWQNKKNDGRKDGNCGNYEIDGIDINCDDEELFTVVYNILLKRKLLKRPLIYTGFICVGMGQTLLNEELGNFTSGILGHPDLNNDEIYQLFGRLTGRMRHWKTFRPTVVYCPSITKYRCQVMEHCSKAISNDHNGEVVSREDYLSPIDTMGEAGKVTNTYIRPISKPSKSRKDREEEKLKAIQYKVFDKQSDAIEYAKKEFKKTIHQRKDTIAPKDVCNDAGENLTEEELIAKLSKLTMPKEQPIRLIPIKKSSKKSITNYTDKGQIQKVQKEGITKKDNGTDINNCKWFLVWNISIITSISISVTATAKTATGKTAKVNNPKEANSDSDSDSD